MWTLFILAGASQIRISRADVAEIRDAVRRISSLAHARIMVPDQSPAEQPFAADGRGPEFALQLYFESRAAADALLTVGSELAHLGLLSRMPPHEVTHQLMQVRSFPTGAAAPAEPCLTFLVTYPGTAEDTRHWLDYYDKNHPPIMVRFPAIREVETYRPVEWTSALPYARGTVLQRNKVVFDKLADLVAALASPVMAEMRADGRTFPPFTGKTTHFPMTTWRVDGLNT